MADHRVLSLPLDKAVIRTNKFGPRPFDFVEAATVTRILNAAFYEWDWEVLEFNTLPIADFDMIFSVHGRLSTRWIEPGTENKKGSFREYIASSSLRDSCLYGEKNVTGIKKMPMSEWLPEHFQPTQLSNIWKSTVTDCIKKCASQFGVALELYGSDTDKQLFKFSLTEKQKSVLSGLREKGLTNEDISFIMSSANMGRGLEDLHDFNVEPFIEAATLYITELKAKR